MTLQPSAINYWAVLAAGLATFFLGGLWYTALFGSSGSSAISFCSWL
jgi:hypothetical protein